MEKAAPAMRWALRLTMLLACAAVGLGQEYATREECAEEPSFDLIHITRLEASSYLVAQESFEVNEVQTQALAITPAPTQLGASVVRSNMTFVLNGVDTPSLEQLVAVVRDLLSRMFTVPEPQIDVAPNATNGTVAIPFQVQTQDRDHANDIFNVWRASAADPIEALDYANSMTKRFEVMGLSTVVTGVVLSSSPQLIIAPPTAPPTLAPSPITPAPTQLGASVVRSSMTIVFGGTTPSSEQIRAVATAALSGALKAPESQISAAVRLHNGTAAVSFEVQTQDPLFANSTFNTLAAAPADPELEVLRNSLQKGLEKGFDILLIGAIVNSLVLSSNPQLIPVPPFTPAPTQTGASVIRGSLNISFTGERPPLGQVTAAVRTLVRELLAPLGAAVVNQTSVVASLASPPPASGPVMILYQVETQDPNVADSLFNALLSPLMDDLKLAGALQSLLRAMGLNTVVVNKASSSIPQLMVPTAAPTPAPTFTPAPTQSGASVVRSGMTFVFSGVTLSLEQIRAAVSAALSALVGAPEPQISVAASLTSPREGLLEGLGAQKTPVNGTVVVSFQVQSQDPNLTNSTYNTLVAAAADPTNLLNALQSSFQALGLNVTIVSVVPSSNPQLIPAAVQGPTPSPTGNSSSSPTPPPTPSSSPTPFPTGPPTPPTASPTSSPTPPPTPSSSPTPFPTGPPTPPAPPTSLPAGGGNGSGTGNSTVPPTSSPTPRPPTPAPTFTPAPTQSGASVVRTSMTITFTGGPPSLEQIRAAVSAALSAFLGALESQITVAASLSSPREGIREGLRVRKTPANGTVVISFQVQTQDPNMATIFFNMLVAAAADPTSLQNALQSSFQALGLGITVVSVVLSPNPQLILAVAPSPTPRSGSGTASATDDPHVENLAGERFQVKQPGGYSLIRVPPMESSPRLVEITAKIKPDASDSCRLYIKGIVVGGRWLGENIVQVLPLERDRPGANTAGQATKNPFRIRIVHPSGNATLSWEELDRAGKGAKVLGSGASIQAFRREELSGVQEGRSFKLLVGTGAKKAEIIVAQASHQALNVKFAKAAHLESHQVGGLMGTEKHDRHIEKATEGCLKKSMPTWTDLSPTYWESLLANAPLMIATWD